MIDYKAPSYERPGISLHHECCLAGIQKLATNSVDAIITDPPYGCGTTINGKGLTPDDMRNLYPFYRQLFQEWARVLQPQGEIYMFTAWRSQAFYYPLLCEALTVRNMITWDKKSGPGNYFNYSTEFIFFATQNKGYKRHKKGRNLWTFPGFAAGAKKEDGAKVHPTQKPTELLRHTINNAVEVPKGAVILDCFAGSASVGVACKQIGHHYIGFEFNLDYFEIACNRLESAQVHT